MVGKRGEPICLSGGLKANKSQASPPAARRSLPYSEQPSETAAFAGSSDNAHYSPLAFPETRPRKTPKVKHSFGSALTFFSHLVHSRGLNSYLYGDDSTASQSHSASISNWTYPKHLPYLRRLSKELQFSSFIPFFSFFSWFLYLSPLLSFLFCSSLKRTCLLGLPCWSFYLTAS